MDQTDSCISDDLTLLTCVGFRLDVTPSIRQESRSMEQELVSGNLGQSICLAFSVILLLNPHGTEACRGKLLFALTWSCAPEFWEKDTRLLYLVSTQANPLKNDLLTVSCTISIHSWFLSTILGRVCHIAGCSGILGVVPWKWGELRCSHIA